MSKHNETLQALCRYYLGKLRNIGMKYGIDVDSIIRANKRKECSGTEYECEMLARLCDDERLTRVEVAKALRKSYRAANDDGDFDKIRKLKHVGIYSKVSTLMNKKKQ